MRCRAHKLQHERAGPSRRGASNTSTRIAPISCANRCSHVPRVDPARQPGPDCPSESCFEALRSTSCGRAASLWIEPWMDSMSAAIFSALSGSSARRVALHGQVGGCPRSGATAISETTATARRPRRELQIAISQAGEPKGLLCVFALERSTQW